MLLKRLANFKLPPLERARIDTRWGAAIREPDVHQPKMAGMPRDQPNWLFLATIEFDDQKLFPLRPVIRSIASPSKVFWGHVGVCCARECMSSNGLHHEI